MCMAVTNALAYYDSESIKEVKCFIVWTQDLIGHPAYDVIQNVIFILVFYLNYNNLIIILSFDVNTYCMYHCGSLNDGHRDIKNEDLTLPY
jgi:hypothetical protein